jgi:hypothetical protein
VELIACRTCGTFMMEGEKKNGHVQQSSNSYTDFFEVEDNINETEENEEDGRNENHDGNTTRLIIARQFANKPFLDQNILPIQILQIIRSRTELRLCSGLCFLLYVTMRYVIILVSYFFYFVYTNLFIISLKKI